MRSIDVQTVGFVNVGLKSRHINHANISNLHPFVSVIALRSELLACQQMNETNFRRTLRNSVHMYTRCHAI